MAEYYSVKDVADRFQVTEAAVRDWIAKRKLAAIQPSGARGAYRIPSAAVEILLQQRSGVRRVDSRPVAKGRAVDLYKERIAPVLRETHASAEVLLERMTQDPSLVARYPSFASDYTTYVKGLAKAVAAVAAGPRVGG